MGSFFLYLFFVIFGTMLPFQGSLQEREALGELSDSNIVNQLLSLLFLISFVSLRGKQKQVWAFIRREKILTLLLLWALASVLWSSSTIVSLKRWITLFGEVVICLAALLHVKWSEVALRSFRLVFMIYFPLTILAVILVPQAIQWEFPAWRGLAPTKNNLGQIALFGIITWFYVIYFHRGRSINVLHYVLLALTLLSFIGARSTTSFLVAGFLLLVVSVQYAGKLIGHAHIVQFFTLLVVSAVVSLGMLVLFFAPEVVEVGLSTFGKDLTFTGRVDLWHTVFAMTEGKMLQGWGIGGFWITGSEHLYPLYQQFVWIPNQAHQGYIDILNQLGIIGVLLLLLMIGNYLKDIKTLRKNNVWKWFFLGLLIFNFQESLFFRPRHIGHFMFIFTYIALYTDLLKERSLSNHP